MRRIALLLAGVAMLGFAVGCGCLFPGHYGYGNNCGYGGGSQPGSPCGPAGCPPGTLGTPGMIPGAVTFPPQGAYNTSYNTMTAARPVTYTTGYPQPVAMGPLESLPTY